ncbi:hypothetical protein [Mycolicibacterium sp. XJ1819]
MTRAEIPLADSSPTRYVQRLGRHAISALMVTAVLSAGISTAPSAAAAPTDSLRAAVMSARQASCGSLVSNPVVEETAEIVNRSTDAWLDHTSRSVPVPDPLPILKDLGYAGGKAVQIEGAGVTDAEAIAGLLLVGYDILPDCSYTDYGLSVLQNQATGHYLTAVVLAGA